MHLADSCFTAIHCHFANYRDTKVLGCYKSSLNAFLIKYVVSVSSEYLGCIAAILSKALSVPNSWPGINFIFLSPTVLIKRKCS